MNEELKKPLCELIVEYPVIIDFFKSYNIDVGNVCRSFSDEIASFSGKFWELNAITPNDFTKTFEEFISTFKVADTQSLITSLKVLPGKGKSGEPEKVELEIKPGEIICIVGPTGSGKSRLLADIEWLANADTPTGRVVHINNNLPDTSLINSMGGKLIAQITQNMNFVLDMNVNEFLLLHAQSRFLDKAEEKVKEVIQLANELSGEQFLPDTPVTFLSGGQSRALMIADVACIGMAPIVLIDEIENAGVDKKKALDLLVSNDKIVLMATHDPLLILQANKRVVIKNGAMQKIITTNKAELEYYKELKELDKKVQKARNFFRLGNELNKENNQLPE